MQLKECLSPSYPLNILFDCNNRGKLHKLIHTFHSGSKVSVVMYSNDRKVRGNLIDTQYTDEYIITDKTISFSHLTPTITGSTVTKNTTEILVLLKMKSNHLKDEGFETVKKLFDSIQGG